MDDAQVGRMLRSDSRQARVDAVRHLVRHNRRLAGSTELRKLLADAFRGDAALRSEGRSLLLAVPGDEFIGFYRSMMTSQELVERRAALEGADSWLQSGAIAQSEMCALLENALSLADPWTRFLTAVQLARLCGRNAWSAAADAIAASETPRTPWWRTIRPQAEEFLLSRGESSGPLNEELVRRGAAPLGQPKQAPGLARSGPRPRKTGA
jgi:hypothetical protein